MALALLIAALSVLAGLAAAIAAHARLWVLAPVRAFAVVAVAAAIAVHILPEAIDHAGWWVLLPFAAGFALPPLVGQAGASLASGHRRIAAEMSYVGVLLHQLGDGLALGAVTGGEHGDHLHWDFILGVGAHTVPLVAVVALSFAELGGRRAALVRTAGLFAATALGIVITRFGGDAILEAGPWLNAAVSGLLFHVLLHDADDRDVPAAARPLEALGAVLGAALPFAMVAHDDHGPLADAIRHGLDDAVFLLAPAVVVGGALATLLAPHHRRSPATMLAIVSGPFTALGLVAGAYALAAAEPAALPHVPGWLGAAAAFAIAAVAVGRIATAGFMAWLGRGHGHGHHHDHHHDH